MFQRRVDGSVDFYLPLDQYTQGFGEVSGEHWLGLEYVRTLTRILGEQLLRIDLTYDSVGMRRYAEYEDFYLESKEYHYELRLGVYVDGSDAG